MLLVRLKRVLQRPNPVPATILICNTSEGIPAEAFCISGQMYSSSIDANSPRRLIASTPFSGFDTTVSISERMRSIALRLNVGRACLQSRRLLRILLEEYREHLVTHHLVRETG